MIDLSRQVECWSAATRAKLVLSWEHPLLKFKYSFTATLQPTGTSLSQHKERIWIIDQPERNVNKHYRPKQSGVSQLDKRSGRQPPRDGFQARSRIRRKARPGTRVLRRTSDLPKWQWRIVVMSRLASIDSRTTRGTPPPPLCSSTGCAIRLRGLRAILPILALLPRAFGSSSALDGSHGTIQGTFSALWHCVFLRFVVDIIHSVTLTLTHGTADEV